MRMCSFYIFLKKFKYIPNYNSSLYEKQYFILKYAINVDFKEKNDNLS
jgi:hypothetical protein